MKRANRSFKIVKRICSLYPFVRIAEFRSKSNFSRNLEFAFIYYCLIVFSMLSISNAVPGQRLNQPASLTEDDILDTIKSLKTKEPSKKVEYYGHRMPREITDEEIRKSILRSQPGWVYELKIHDIELISQIREFVSSITGLYQRKHYEIIVFEHKTPYIMLDAGVLLVVSTGLFAEAESDDEILGYIAHEVGHEYYKDYSILTKHLLNLSNIANSEPAISRRYGDVLALIELQCDAFSAITLAHLDYDPAAFISGIERNSKKFRAAPDAVHPPTAMRRRVVEGVIPGYYLNKTEIKKSLIFETIKKRIGKKYNKT